jgi:hypothetical protein
MSFPAPFDPFTSSPRPAPPAWKPSGLELAIAGAVVLGVGIVIGRWLRQQTSGLSDWTQPGASPWGGYGVP